MVRVPLYPVQAGHVTESVGWFDEHWRDPGPFIPDELLVLVEAA